MKANELMIGDWVMYNGNIFIDDEYEPSVPIEPKQIDSGEDIDLAIEGCYTPIPLTPEILEKNGWKTDGHTWWRNDEGFSISGEYYRRKSGEPLYISVTGESTCDLEYVHELQHALRLCGLNDLANNFTI